MQYPKLKPTYAHTNPESTAPFRRSAPKSVQGAGPDGFIGDDLQNACLPLSSIGRSGMAECIDNGTR